MALKFCLLAWQGRVTLVTLLLDDVQCFGKQKLKTSQVLRRLWFSKQQCFTYFPAGFLQIHHNYKWKNYSKRWPLPYLAYWDSREKPRADHTMEINSEPKTVCLGYSWVAVMLIPQGLSTPALHEHMWPCTDPDAFWVEQCASSTLMCPWVGVGAGHWLCERMSFNIS